MKIRTDFVTNSSSSNYCIGYKVNSTTRKTAIKLLFYPNQDGDADFYLGSAVEIDALVEQIKSCTSVDELSALLINNFVVDRADELNFDFANNEDLFAKLSEISSSLEDYYDGDEAGYYATEMAPQVMKFKKQLARIYNLSDIKSVTIVECFDGWGEFAPEGVLDFMERAIPEKLDWDDKNAVKDALADRFTEEEIDLMMDVSSVAFYDARIETWVDLSNGLVEKKYSISGDVCGW